MYKVLVVGVAAEGLSNSQRKALSSCTLLVGTDRLLPLASDLCPHTTSITPLDTAMKTIETGLASGNVGVLASGDPLFFGIGRTLLNHFGEEQVTIYPALSSIQEAMARFKLPWEDAVIVSLHGRIYKHIPGILLSQEKTIVFTDRHHSPKMIASELISYLEKIEDHALLEQCQLLVAENIGTEAERCFTGNLYEAAQERFNPLNVCCLLCPPVNQASQENMGLTEIELAHSRGLITKDEVRAATLHRLRLPRSGIFWDIGAGSGSISIEAARMNPGLTIYAVERKEEELENIKANIRRFGCYNVVPVAGLALDCIAALPSPDRVFIGGNGGQLPGIVASAAKRIPHKGIIVANGVIAQTIEAAPKLMEKAGLKVQISTLAVTRSTPGHKPVTFNQIALIAGRKE